MGCAIQSQKIVSQRTVWRVGFKNKVEKYFLDDEVINKSNNTSCEDEECPPSYLEATNSPDDQQTALNLDLPEDLQTMDDPEVTIISQESDVVMIETRGIINENSAQ